MIQRKKAYSIPYFSLLRLFRPIFGQHRTVALSDVTKQQLQRHGSRWWRYYDREHGAYPRPLRSDDQAVDGRKYSLKMGGKEVRRRRCCAVRPSQLVERYCDRPPSKSWNSTPICMFWRAPCVDYTRTIARHITCCVCWGKYTWFGRVIFTAIFT